MRFCLFSLLLLVGLTLPVEAAQPVVSDISGTWAGLDKTTVAIQLSSVVLTIEATINQSIQGTLVSTTKQRNTTPVTLNPNEIVY